MSPGRNRSRSAVFGPTTSIWRLAVMLALLSVFLPFESGQSLFGMALPQGLGGYIGLIFQQGYELIKSAILWVPVGVLAAFIGKERVARGAALILMPSLLLLGLPLLAEPHTTDLMQILFAFPGLAAGLWLGGRTRLRAAMVGGKPRAAAQPAQARTGAGGRSDAKLEGSDVSHPVLRGNEVGPGGNTQILASPATAVAFDPGARASSIPTVPPLPTPSLWGAGPLSASFALGLCLLGLVGYGLYDFPRWQPALAVLLTLYAGMLWRWPQAWLVVVPAALPLFDLAPWTGRFFFDEFDLLMLLTLAMALLRGWPKPKSSLPLLTLFGFGLLALSIVVSTLIGLLPLLPLDANVTASYWSSYNSLRVAKGFLWGGLLFLWVHRDQADYHVLAQRLSLGMGLGLFGVGVVGAWEHGLFVGFEGGYEWYRIVSTFSSMHTGGGHIEAYLVAALPFLWLATPKFRHLALTGPLMALTAYVMVYTVARGGVLALGVVIIILFVASLRLALRTRGHRFIAPVGMLVVVGLVLAAGVGGGYFQKRFAETGQDWQTRLDHWAQAIDMMNGSLKAQLFGMGLGSFPRTYLERGPADNQPATFGFASEQDNTYFRLGSGQTVYYAQRVPFTAGKRYRLEMDVRSRQGDARLETPVCEKQLLNSRQCEWSSIAIPGDGAWHRLSHDIFSTKVGAEGVLHRPPVEIFLYNPGKGGVVDVDNLRLLGPDGRDVLCNGDFSRGGDCWFFKTHSHLPWHVKNVWVHVLFEQGWVGLLIFAGVTLLALTRLAREGWKGHRLAWAWLASLAGLLTVGMFDSLVDAPRLATLLVATTLLGVAPPWLRKFSSSRHRQRRGG